MGMTVEESLRESFAASLHATLPWQSVGRWLVGSAAERAAGAIRRQPAGGVLRRRRQGPRRLEMETLFRDLPPAPESFRRSEARRRGNRRLQWGQQVPQVDVLIDDGGHEPEQQMATVEAMLPHLRPGGVYICEDITCSDNRFSTFTHTLVDGLHAYAPTVSQAGNASPASPFQSSIHSIHVYPFVVVIEKRAALMPSFCGPKHGTQWQPYL